MPKTKVSLDQSNRKLKSKGKIGRAIVSTSRTADTCPNDCPFKRLGITHTPTNGGTACYAAQKARGGQSIFEFAEKGGYEQTRDAMELLRLRTPPGAAVRHLVSGDVDDDYIEEANRLHAQRPDLIGWGYTHNWRNLDPKSVKGWVLNASCETHDEVKEAIKAGWQTVLTSPENDQLKGQVIEGRKVHTCPAEGRKIEVPVMDPETGEQRINKRTKQPHFRKEATVGCADCIACGADTRTRPVIEFPAHGSYGKIVTDIIIQRRDAATGAPPAEGSVTMDRADHFKHGAEGN